MFAASKSGQVTGSTPPPTPTNDPQFPYVTALLTGNGTNGAQNNTFIDSSPNNFTITRTGNTTQGSASPYGGNWSNYFDGSSYLTVPAGTAFAPLTGDFTVEGWINPSGLMSGYGMIYGQTYSGSNYFTIFATDGTVKFINPSGTWSSGANLWTVGSWNHFAVVRNGGSTRVYLNGLGGTAAADAYNYNEVTVLPTIGRYTHTGSNFYYGYISNLRYVKGTALYTANFTPSTTPLTPITNTSLLTCQSPRFVDNSINNFTVTNNGNTNVQVFSPFEPATLTPISYSGSFDGTGDYLSLATNAAFNITSGSTDSFICEFWVKFSSVAANTSLVDNGGLSGATLSNWNIQLNASQQFGIVWGNEGAQQGILASSTVPTTGQWYHIALVKTNADWALFINGARGISYNGINTASKSSATALYIGYGITTSAGGNGLNGVVSNVRIYKGATATAPYLATSTTITVPTLPLAAITNTSLLTCQSNTFVDNSPNNFAITPFGDAKTTIQNPFGTTSALTTGYSTSVNGASMYFDGGGDYLTINDPAYNLSVGSGDFTYETWVYLDTLPAIVSSFYHLKNDTGTGTTVFILEITSGGAVSLSTGLVLIASGTSGKLIPKTWVHFAFVRTSGVFKTYINGVQDISIANTTTYNGTYVQVGAWRYGSYDYSLTGYLSNTRIAKGTALYKSNFVPPVAPVTVVSNTSLLLNGTNGGIIDNAMMNDYETVGNTQISTAVVKYGTGSMYFDGTGDYLISPISLSLGMGSGDFTIEGWFYLPSPTYTQGLFHINATPIGGTVAGYAIGVTPSGAVQYYSGNTFTTASSTITANTWTHLAMVRSAGTVKVYVNGVLPTTGGSIADSQNLTTALAYLGVFYAPNYPMVGYIDDFRITKYARYVANFTPPTQAFPTF